MQYLSVFVCSLFLASSVSAQTWSWSQPAKAGTSMEVKVKEVPAHESPLHAAVYTLDGTKLTAMDAMLTPGDMQDAYTIAVAIPAQASWVSVTLKDDQGEFIASTQEYVANDKAKIKAWAIEKALALSTYSRYVGLEADNIEATTMFRDAIITNPEWLDQPDVLRAYYQMAKATEAREDINNVKVYLTQLSLKPKDASEAQLVGAVRLAKAMADETLEKSLRKALDKSYPKSLLAQEEAMIEFRKLTDVTEQAAAKDAFIKKYGSSESNKRLIDQMTATIAQQYAGMGKWDLVKASVNQIQDPMTQASTCNMFAWDLSGESVDKEGSHYDVAAELSAKSLKNLASDPPAPSYLTKSEWNKNLEYQKGQFGDTYALILYKQGRIDEAIKYQHHAVEVNDYSEGEINERYAVYLDAGKKYDELESFMDKIMVMGKGTERMKALHKTYWTSKVSTEELYQQYVTQLNERAEEHMISTIAKQWKNEASFPFTLKDTDGRDVSLSDYKGKTVVLDFWATWCGPCKASFPGMKKAIENFASDKDVVFLFVNTWENKENMESRVSGFIKDNNYPFHVIYDAEDRIVADYKVSGIPTKFIIGPDQRIHFISVGFSGNNDELAEELRIMIDLAKKGGLRT